MPRPCLWPPMPPGLAGSQTRQTFQGCRARLLSIRCVLHPWKNLGLGLRKTHPYRPSWAQPPAFNPQVGASVCEEDCNTWGSQDVTHGKWEVSSIHGVASCVCPPRIPLRLPRLRGPPLLGLQFPLALLCLVCPGCFVGQMGRGQRPPLDLCPRPPFLLSHLAVRRALGARPKCCGGK